MAINYFGAGGAVQLDPQFCNRYPQFCRELPPLGNSSGGGNVNVTTLPSGQVIVTSGQTTLDKVLATALASLALLKGSPYIPTTQQPQQQPYYPQQYPPEYYANLSGGVGSKFGDSVQRLIEQNPLLLLGGGLAVVLYLSGRK